MPDAGSGFSKQVLESHLTPLSAKLESHKQKEVGRSRMQTIGLGDVSAQATGPELGL